jgi:hypothetical protein
VKPGIIDKIECIRCGAICSIEHGGKSDITQHINTKRHKLAGKSEKGNSVTNYFTKKKMLTVIIYHTQMKERRLVMCTRITIVLYLWTVLHS